MLEKIVNCSTGTEKSKELSEKIKAH